MKILKLLLAVFVVTLLFSQCKYNFIVPFEDPDTDIDNPDSTVVVSFSADILPIFNSGNNCTTSACHVTGKQSPDLTPDKAFNAINSSRYIDTTPNQSKIYLYTHPDTNTHTRKKYNSLQAAKILKWIEQGAKNN